MEKIFFTALLALAPTYSMAAFVSTDWKADGDQRAMLHEETGIEWLKLPETTGMSINQVQSQLDSTFAGWRFPTKAEVTAMLSQAYNVNLPTTSWVSQAFNPNAAAYTSAIGASFINTPGQPGAVHGWPYVQSYAMYTDELNRLNYAGVYYSGTTVTYSYSNNLVAGNLNYTSYAYSVFLVSDGGTTLSSIQNPLLNANNPNAPMANVPVPLWGMGAMMLLGLAARRRQPH